MIKACSLLKFCNSIVFAALVFSKAICWSAVKFMLAISENNANRANEIVLQKLAADASTDAAKLQADIEASAGAGDFVKEVFLKIIGI